MAEDIKVYSYIEPILKRLNLKIPEGDNGYVLGVDSVAYSVQSLENFVKEFDVVKFMYSTKDIIEKYFKGLGDPRKFTECSIYDNARMVENSRGDYLLVLQTYCDEIKIHNILTECSSKYSILGRNASWVSRGVTNLVVIYSDKNKG